MPIFRRSLLALLLVTAAPLPAAAAAPGWLYEGSDITPDPAWQFGTLPNGLHYAVRQNALPDDQVSIRVRIGTGALSERDEEQGWAHFVEHLAFRGTENFDDREARHIWQKLGASFGSDTNATTDATQTVYQLDLPRADRASLDTSLHVLSEMVDSAQFDPAAVEAERKIVMAEKNRRPELSTKLNEVMRPLFYAGLKFAERDTIGTDETLAAATPEGLRAFYERWYRPENATVVMVGDADPAMMIELIEQRFGGWRGTGPTPEEPDYGAIAEVEERASTLAYPAAPHAASLIWLRPYEDLPHTLAREKADLARSLAGKILNRRLEGKARDGAAFIGAGVASNRSTNIADATQLSITAKGEEWRKALTESFAIVNDALKTPPSETEIERELQNLRMQATSALQGEPTVKSQVRAQQLVNAIDGGNVVATAETSLAVLDRFAPQMTPALIHEAMREMFAGEGPRMLLLSPEPVEGGPAAVGAALALAEEAEPATRMAERKVSMDALPPLGEPASEVSRQKIEDLGVTIVRFDNGSTLLFKPTDFEKGSVSVALRFGEGLAGLHPQRASLAWLEGMIAPSGLADLDLDGMERLMTGRRMGLSFDAEEDAYELKGTTSGQDLTDQLRLLATKLAFPRWDESLFERYRTGALESYDLAFASAATRAGRELNGFVRSGDERWDPVEKTEMETVSVEDFQSFFTPLLKQGPIEGIIVGDVDIETAVQAFAKTVGALPKREPVEVPAAARAVEPPAPNPEPVIFTHEGDPDQAYAVIGWSTFGGTDRIRERRALSLAANLFQVRLFDRLREEEGATYAPSAQAASSETLPEWGIFMAGAEIKPEARDTFFRIAREIVADLAASPVPADEFARAQNPVVSGIERRLKTNGYWLSTMENWSSDPELIEQTRSFLADYKSLTPEYVRDVVAAHVADAGDWSMLVLPGKAKGSGN